MKRTIRVIRSYLETVGLSGLLCAIKAKAANDTVYYQMSRQECQHPFRLRIPSSDVPTYRQVFINQEYDFVIERQPSVIVDAGANIGLVSLYLANKYPEATIIALEPEQSNFELLKENVAPYPRIIPLQAALWDKNEEINVIDPGLGKWGFMTERKHRSENPRGTICHPVMAITVDTIMKYYDLSKIDILKVDIEGAEKEVFSDPSSWIEKIDSIIIELHDRLKAGCSRSFYCGTNGFDHEWMQGENVFLSRGTLLTRRIT